MNATPITKRLVVLGSTGSVGVQTLEVVAHVNALARRGASPVGFEVVGLAAGSNATLLSEQARRWGVERTALADRDGADAAERLVRTTPCDLVVAAIVGIAGLPATHAAVELGTDVALANKETLVAAGGVIVPLAQRTGARLLPVDSEHAAAWQCLRCVTDQRPPLTTPASVRRLVLTASGGPFHGWGREQLEHATPTQALRHPRWAMGKKVTIDSATLMNKALELVEAHWLFGLAWDRLGAVVHPQSSVHAILELADGSTISQSAPADMRVPIQRALTHPWSVEGLVPATGARGVHGLSFGAVEDGLFPSVSLARRVIEEGGSSGCVLNAANEVAVGAFLRGQIGFLRIAEVVREVMETVPISAIASIDDAMACDALARARAEVLVRARAGR